MQLAKPILVTRCRCASIGGLLSKVGCRRLASSTNAWKVQDSMNNPEVADFNQKLKLQVNKIPPIAHPKDVLVKVHASSVNPLDLRMVYGYGRRVLDILDWSTNSEPRITNDRYPLTLGRDFSGEVIAAGPTADCRVGDHVFGVIEPHKSGSHSQYVTASSCCLVPKPDNISHIEAASIPFAALTAYSALSTFGGLSKSNCSGKRVLVIGGSGGVGSTAVQLLRAWGASVSATSCADKIDWLETSLFVDEAVSHDDSSRMSSLEGRFDFVLDCGNYQKTSLTHDDILDNSLKYLKPHSQAIYVTISPPLLNNTDRNGLILGTAKSVVEAAVDTVKSLRGFNSARWAFFLPNKKALKHVADLLEKEVIYPKVSSVFAFDKVPEAFEQLQNGLAKGKIVIDVSGETEPSKNQETQN